MCVQDLCYGWMAHWPAVAAGGVASTQGVVASAAVGNVWPQYRLSHGDGMVRVAVWFDVPAVAYVQAQPG
jgi:hypothetical protein